MTALDPPGPFLGRSWASPGPWGALGAYLGRSWQLLAALGPRLGRPGALLGALGASRAALGALWAAQKSRSAEKPNFVDSTAFFMVFGGSGRPPGASWGSLGALVAAPGALLAALGLPLAVLSGSWVALGRAQWVPGGSGVALASSLGGPGIAARPNRPGPRTCSLYRFVFSLGICLTTGQRPISFDIFRFSRILEDLSMEFHVYLS